MAGIARKGRRIAGARQAGRGLAWAGAALALVLTWAAAPTQAAEAVNLVVNGDFAKVAADGRPEHWQAAGDSGVVQRLEAARDADGRPYARLVCAEFKQSGPSSHAMLAQVGAVRLVGGRMYEFSCRARAEGIGGRSVSVAISDMKDWSNAGLEGSLRVGRAWRTHRRVFHATRDVGPTSRLQIWFGETGTLSLADVRIVEWRPEAVVFTNVVPAAGGKNLVPNGSFEVGAGGWSSLGQGAGWGDLDRLHGRIERSGGTQGQAFLRIPLGGRATPVLYFDYYEPVVRRELRPLAANLGWIEVEKGAAYTLSCDLRAGRDGVRAMLGLRTADPSGSEQTLTQTVRLGTAWKRYAVTFKPARRYAFVLVGPDLEEEEDVQVDVDAVQLEKGERATDFEPRAAVEFAFEPSEAAGIFEAGRSASLIVRACNHGGSAARATVRFQVTDFLDQPAPLEDVAFEVPARATAERPVPVPEAWRGYYRVRATAEAGGRTERATVRLAVVPRRTAADSVCGINHAFTTADMIRLASKAGVTWYRDWSLKWQHVEPARGEWHWDRADAQIDRVLAEGVKVLPLLPPFPSAEWSSEAPANLKTDGYPGVRLRQAWAPKDPRDLAAFVEKAAARYKDRVGVWEFLNEPIYTDYTLPADTTNRYGGRKYAPADYVALLGTAAAAMRRGNPQCKVMGGIGSGALHLTREVIDAGLLDHADLVNLHFYPGSRTPEGFAAEMDALLAMMDAHGGRKPIWVTEFSYYAADDLPREPFFSQENSWAEHRLLESERQGADFTVRFFAIMLARGVEKIFIHSGAGGKANDPNFECALVDYGGAPRKLFPALAVMTDLAGPSPRFAGERRFGESAWAVAFETGRQAVALAWADEDGVGASVTFPAASKGTRWVDPMGRDLAGRAARLSESPIYLVAPAGRAKACLDAIEFTAPAP